jgi:predicted transcriptional regulator
VKGKRVQFDDETWVAIDTLARDRKRDFQELAKEAFADLLKKHDRPVSLKDALRQSVRRGAANDSADASLKNLARTPTGGRKR